MRDVPRQKKPETVAETRLKKYISQHGISDFFDDKPDEHIFRVTGRDRPISRLRKNKSNIYANDLSPGYNND